MTVAEMIARIDAHGFDDLTTTEKVALINDVVWDICSLELWPFLEKTATFVFNGSSAAPTNYPTDVDVIKAIVDTQWPRRLYPIRWENFRENVSNTATNTGDPGLYYFIGSTLYVQPVPAATNTTTIMLYLAQQAELTSTSVEADILIPFRYHNAIVYGALSQLYAEEDDAENANLFENRYDKRMLKMHDRLFQQQVDRNDTIEITDPDDAWDLYL